MKKMRRKVLVWLLVLVQCMTGMGVSASAADISKDEESPVIGQEPTGPTATDEEEAEIRVGFSCRVQNVMYTVMQGDTVYLPDEDGVYLLNAGEYCLKASAEGYEDLEMPFEVLTGADEIVFEVKFPEEEAIEEPSDPEEEFSEEESAEPAEDLTEESPEEETSEEDAEPCEETSEEEAAEPTEEVTEDTSEEEAAEPTAETSEEEAAEPVEDTSEEAAELSEEELTELKEDLTQEASEEEPVEPAEETSEEEAVDPVEDTDKEESAESPEEELTETAEELTEETSEEEAADPSEEISEEDTTEKSAEPAEDTSEEEAAEPVEETSEEEPADPSEDTSEEEPTEPSEGIPADVRKDDLDPRGTKAMLNTTADDLNIREDGYAVLGRQLATILDPGETACYTFIPAESGDYIIYTEGDKDTYGYLFNSAWELTREDDDSGVNNNFYILEQLKAGQIYHIGVRFYDPQVTGDVTLTIWKAGWYYAGSYWYYINEDGSFVTGDKYIDGKWYYFDDDHHMVMHQIITHMEEGRPAAYYYDTSGARVTKKGWVSTPDGYLYIKNAAVASGWNEVDGKTYYLSPYMAFGGPVMVYDSSQGASVPFFFEKNGALHTEAGWVKDAYQEYAYVMDASGKVYADTVVTIGGKLYGFRENGRMYHDCIFKQNDIYYLAESSGAAVKMSVGWNKIGSVWYYLQTDGTLVSNTVQKIGSSLYGFDKNGRMYNNRDFWLGSQYFMARSGGALYAEEWVKQEDGRWYYFLSNGAGAEGAVTVSGALYVFTHGRMNIGPDLISSGGVNYLIAKSGKAAAVKEGWNKVDDKYYYMTEGEVQKSKLLRIDGSLYFFDSYGEMLADRQWNWTIDGSRRYFRAGPGGKLYENSWVQVGKDWYYYGTNGYAPEGLTAIGGKQYLFKEGKMLTNVIMEVGSDLYHTDSQGIAKKVTADGMYYQYDRRSFFYISGGKLLKDVWKKVNGKWYYFDGAGYALTKGPHLLSADYYYFNIRGEMFADGWITAERDSTAETRYYASASGKLLLGDQKIDGKWYYFEPEMAAGVIQNDEGKMYLYGPDGVYIGKAERNGWNEIRGTWYYVSDGTLAADELRQIGTGWYYFDEDGKMVKDMIVNGQVFGSDGKMITGGWANITGDYYYVDPITRVLVKGFYTVGGKEYYFRDNGTMFKGEYTESTEDGCICYVFGSGGALQSKTILKEGWNKINGTQYYVRDGKLYTGWLGDYCIDKGKMSLDSVKDHIYLGPDGKAVRTSGFIDRPSRSRIYIKSDGKVLYDAWAKVSGSWYYADGHSIIRGSTAYIDGKIYQFDAEGKMTAELVSCDKDGWVKVGTEYMYISGNKPVQSEIRVIGGFMYAFDSKGWMIRDNVSSVYEWAFSYSAYYYFGADGKRVEKTGWQKINGVWYYFYDDHSLANGFTTIGGKTYFFRDTVMQTGNMVYSGRWYEFGAGGALIADRTPENGWFKVGEDWYYARNGYTVGAFGTSINLFNIITIGGKTYGFDLEGRMIRNEPLFIIFSGSGDRFFFGADGTIQKQTGWKKCQNGRYVYTDADGRCLTGVREIGGKTYYFTSDGYWIK
ncbi:MAG: hypothetical protein IJL98_09620 [Lachnospiraceae bacterium]|nr:hypothetical protein [Lachnospiraceae bacterium]